MLVQVTVGNYRSFKDETTLSMVASHIEEYPEQVLKVSKPGSLNLLRAAGIFGANASGKSNLIRAMALAKDLVVNGTRSGALIRDVTPFRLDPNFAPRPSTFDFVIDLDGRLYSYGFAVTSQAVVEEWLLAREATKKKEAMWFERTTARSGDVNVKFGKHFGGTGTKATDFLRFVATGTRPNQLFLTEAIDRNVGELQPLAEWFKAINFMLPGGGDPLIELLGRAETDRVRFVLDVLHGAGTGIQAIVSEETPLDLDGHIPGVPRQALSLMISDLKPGDIALIKSTSGPRLVMRAADGSPKLLAARTLHRTSEGGTVAFEFEDESAGTLRLLQLAPILFLMRRSDSLFVIDELERSLHPLLTKRFVQTALSDAAGPNSQLIFSTHDTDLLDDIMRRDEIWLIEKGEDGASHLRSLAEFDIRPDLKIRKSYLNGRFGAIPLVEDLTEAKADMPSGSPR